jgi:hypothetical protein
MKVVKKVRIDQAAAVITSVVRTVTSRRLPRAHYLTKMWKQGMNTEFRRGNTLKTYEGRRWIEVVMIVPCPMVDFRISSGEPSGFSTTVLVNTD